jgi:hypothetical protein
MAEMYTWSVHRVSHNSYIVQPLATRTFINALESSPVHCVKPRPTGKRLKPVNGGASDILY